MKKALHTHNQKGSIVLGLVFGVGIFGLAIATTALTLSTTALVNNVTAISGTETLVTADAALREGIFRVVEDYKPDDTVTFTNTSVPLINNTNSTDVSVTGSWPVYKITSVATNDQITRKVVSELDFFPSAFVFDQAVYTYGALDIGGNAQINGNVYAEDGVDFTGAASEVDGDAYSPTTIHPHNGNSILGDSIDNHMSIEPPIINTSDYEAVATTIPNEALAQAAIQTLDNVILHITAPGEVNISGGDFTGMIIVDNDLKLTGGTELTAGPAFGFDEPLVLYVGGDLTLGGNITINGIVYVEGETSVGAGTPEINGSLISVSSGNDVDFTGNITVTFNQGYADDWNEITGLDTNSGTDPYTKNWHEE